MPRRKKQNTTTNRHAHKHQASNISCNPLQSTPEVKTPKTNHSGLKSPGSLKRSLPGTTSGGWVLQGTLAVVSLTAVGLGAAYTYNADKALEDNTKQAVEEQATPDRVEFRSGINQDTYERVQALRQDLDLGNADLAAMGLTPEEAKVFFENFMYYTLAAQDTLDETRLEAVNARRALQQALRQSALGTAPEVSRSSTRDSFDETAYADSSRQITENDIERLTLAVEASEEACKLLHERIAQQAMLHLSSDSRMTWENARSNPEVRDARRYVHENLTEEDLARLAVDDASVQDVEERCQACLPGIFDAEKSHWYGDELTDSTSR